MSDKKYYAARKGILKPEPVDLQLLKKVFLRIYREFEDDLYFQEATGYHCVDKGEVRGLWGRGDSDSEAFIYLELGMDDIWPIEKNIENYDEPTLFTVIEFLYDHVSEPIDKWYHRWDNCGWHSSKYDRENGRAAYRKNLNEILKDYDCGYQLSSDGEILEIAPTGLEPIFEEIVQTDDPENIDMRRQNAISKYMRHHATTSDKKDAIRELADVLEFLKKDGVRLPSKDESDLFKIINNFDIRHHNKSQHAEYDREIWYEWMFYTFLSSINVLSKLKGGESGD
ncbi:MAG TPA: hypothetical protein EYP67_06870 [Methanosarcinales archaeon]|nr:hypothetical protein [Methanosarcinales archaeon]